MAEVASAFVSIVPSARGFGSKLTQQVGGETDSAGKAVGKRFGSAVKLGALAIVGGSAALLGGFLKSSIGEAREAQKVGAQTNSVIKATGGAAKVSARQVGDLATAISLKTGIDDEVIQSGENMLLTFKNIRNEAGKGNDIFNQSTKVLTDMSTAMGTEPKQAAIQLGKALNDPVKGITALTRVGVTFSDQQKKQIKTLVAGGKTMQAQKIILKELNSEFGGSAAAQATAGDKFKVAFGNLEESVGTALLPLLDRVLNGLTTMAVFATNNVGPAFAKIGTFLAPAKAAIAGLFSGGGGAGGLIATVQTIASSIQTNFLPVLQTAANTFTTLVLPALLRVGGYLQANLLPIFRQVGTIIATNVVPIVASLARFFYGVLYPAVFRIVAAIATQLKPVFDALFGTIQANVLPAVQRLLVKFQQWQPTIQRVVVIVLKVVGAVLILAAAILGRVLPVVIRFAGFLIGRLVGVIGAVIGALVHMVGFFIRVGGAVGSAIGAFARFSNAVDSHIRAALRVIAGLPGKITAAFSGAGNLLVSIGGDIVNGLVRGITNAAGKVLAAAKSLIDKIPGPIRKAMGIASPSKVMDKIGRQIGDGLLKGLKAKEQALKDQISTITDTLDGLKSSAADLMSGIADKFKVDVFGGNLKQLRAGLAQSTADAQAFLAALGAGIKNGLSGAFYQSLAQSGNLKLAQEIAALSPSDLAVLQGQFGARNSAADLVGQKVSDDFFAKPIHDQTAVLNGIRADLQAVLKREHKIEIHDKSGNPKKTARETSRRLRWAGAH